MDVTRKKKNTAIVIQLQLMRFCGKLNHKMNVSKHFTQIFNSMK